MKPRCILITALAVILTMLGGCVSDRSVIHQANTMNQALEPAIIDDPVLNEYLQSVGDRIIQVAQEMSAQGYGPKAHLKERSDWMFSNRMKFHFVNSSTINAFTTGGEHMYIYTELFRQCRSEDELAAVMAHEYAHVYGRHVAKGMNRHYTALAAAAALGGAGYAAGGKEKREEYAAMGFGAGLMAGQFVNMGFSRKDETEADDLGFNFYVRAGWDPDRFADFFRQMIEKGHDTTPQMLSGHPSLSRRVEHAAKRVSRLPPDASQWRRPPVADAKRFAELQRRATEVATDIPDDKTLVSAKQLLQALPRSCIMPHDPADAVEAREALMGAGEAEP